MIIIFVRSLILYIFVLITLRVMGKGELSQMQPFEFVVMLMIAENAALPMEDTGVPLINGFVAVGTLLLAQLLISYINLKSVYARRIICGKPSLIINKGMIDEEELKNLRININDLIEQLRIKDYPSLADVEYAILETNGDLSVIPKADKKNITLKDLNKSVDSEELPLALIIDGKINNYNIKISRISESELLSEIKSKGIDKINQVLFAFIDEKGTIHIQSKK